MTVKKFWSKIFLVGIDLECYKTYFEPKFSKLKKISRVKIFPGTQSFLGQNGQNSEKMTKSKNLGRKNFYGRNRFRMLQNVFQTEYLEIEILLPC